jgi:uncharacterized protein (DUF1778 family)
MAKNKQMSGGARLRASGKRAVLLGLTPEQHAAIRAAAESEGRPVTQFLVFHGLAAAKKANRRNNSEGR